MFELFPTFAELHDKFFLLSNHIDQPQLNFYYWESQVSEHMLQYLLVLIPFYLPVYEYSFTNSFITKPKHSLLDQGMGVNNSVLK